MVVSIGKDFDYGARILKNSKGIVMSVSRAMIRPVPSKSPALTAAEANNVLIFISALPYRDICVTVYK